MVCREVDKKADVEVAVLSSKDITVFVAIVLRRQANHAFLVNEPNKFLDIGLHLIPNTGYKADRDGQRLRTVMRW